MRITPYEAARELDQDQYREEGSKELFAKMKEAGIVAVFGGSDGLIEFRGAINDEVGAPTAYVTSGGLLENDCEDEDCPYFLKLMVKATKIEANWAPEGEDISWSYTTVIPHITFDIKEDDETYCRGIVFYLEAVGGH